MASTTIVLIAVGALMVGMVVVYVVKEALNCLFKTLLLLGAFGAPAPEEGERRPQEPMTAKGRWVLVEAVKSFLFELVL